MSRKSSSINILVLLSSLLISSCLQREVQHGFIFSNIINRDSVHVSAESDLAQITSRIMVGYSKKSDIQLLLGSPNFVITNPNGTESTWYYASQTLKWRAFLSKKVTEQSILEIKFNQNNFVTRVITNSQVSKSGS